ncbi:DUF434 domain-containing protein [Clostridium sp.]|uniref:DUF434 domain-containing protein n=1 Tax=Clostridium sp. TaxID=1506 RepID=UPI001B75230A|nr:DUF434 domain-containing protein [Clostridium sp.]MBP3916850.1 DUF434 domain-containing protein [Clostridium sp.]
MDEAKKSTIRGKEDKDERFFSSEEIKRLKYAQEEVVWLLNRNYPISNIIDFVGGRHQFSSRQRMALRRASCSNMDLEIRRGKEVSVYDLEGKTINIDTFNFIISLEVALSKGVLINCMDGSIRDLAGLRGTYKLIDKTYMALDILGDVFKKLKIKGVNFYIDAPVSNSGRLKTAIYEISEKWDVDVNVEVVSNPDVILEKSNYVVSSDSIILDKCDGWINLVRYIVKEYIKEVWIIDLREE